MKSDEEDKVFTSVGSLTSNKGRRREKMKGRSFRKPKRNNLLRSTSETRRDWKKRKGEVFDLLPEKVNFDSKKESSSDWSGRGTRRRRNSTMSTSSGGRLHGLRSMMRSLSVAVQNASALGEELKNEQAAARSEQAPTANSNTTDLKRVRTMTRRKAMETDVEEKCKGQWPRSFVTVNGWWICTKNAKYDGQC